MITAEFGLGLDTSIRVEGRKDYGIGIVGAGAIVRHGHLPAYRAAGLNVVGITDLEPVRARELAAQFDVIRVHESVEALIADPAVAIVDIAIPTEAQHGI